MSALFVVLLSAVARGHERYIDDQRYPMLLLIKADNESQIWASSAERLAAYRWHDLQFERFGELDAPVDDIDDEILRGAAKEAATGGFAFVVYDQSISARH